MPVPMMMLVNPAAGRSLSRAALGSVVHTFASAGYAPTTYFTANPGDAVSLAAQYGGNYERLICLGGDGTLSDTISGLMQIPADRRPLLGYIPMGTTNDVAVTLGLPIRQPARAAQILLPGRSLSYDVGELVGTGFFSYIAAFGLFTEISYKTNQELKRALGHAAYLMQGITSIAALRTYKVRVEYDGGVLEDEVIYGALSNAMSVGGVVRMSRELVNLSDGLFELILVRRPKDVPELNAMIGGILSQNYDSPCLTVLHSSHVKFTFEEAIPWTRDGEDGGIHRELTLRCHPNAVALQY